MVWVKLSDALAYNLLPADRKVVMHMTKTKEQTPKTSIQSFLSSKIERPTLNLKTHRWEIKQGAECYTFNTHKEAIDFYITESRKILMPFFGGTQKIHG